MNNSTIKIIAEIDTSNIRMIAYTLIDNRAVILFDKLYVVDVLYNLENEIFDLKSFINNCHNLGFTTDNKIDLVYKNNIFDVTKTDYNYQFKLTANQLNKKSVQNFLDKMVKTYEKNNLNHYVININPYSYADLNLDNEVLSVVNDFNQLKISQKKILITSKIVYGKKDAILRIKQCFANINLKINKIYSFAELITNKINNLNYEAFINIHLDENLTYINDKINEVYNVINFGEFSFIKYIMESLNLTLIDAEKEHYLYRSYLEFNNDIFDKFISKKKLIINQYGELLSYYWNIIFESLNKIKQNLILIFSGNFSFMGRMKKIAEKIFNNPIIFIDDYQHSQLFNSKTISVEQISQSFIQSEEKVKI